MMTLSKLQKNIKYFGFDDISIVDLLKSRGSIHLINSIMEIDERERYRSQPGNPQKFLKSNNKSHQTPTEASQKTNPGKESRRKTRITSKERKYKSGSHVFQTPQIGIFSFLNSTPLSVFKD